MQSRYGRLAGVLAGIALAGGAFGTGWAQSGSDVFGSVCAECHSSNFYDTQEISTDGGTCYAPPLARPVERLGEDGFLTRIRNGRFYCGMNNFPGLTDDEIRSVWRYINEAISENGPAIPEGETDEQRSKRIRCENTRYRMDNPPPEPPAYFPPDHSECSDGWPDGVPYRPGPAGYFSQICKPWISDEDRQWWAANCQTVRGVDVVDMTIPEIRAQIPEKTRKALRERLPGGILSKREFEIPEDVRALQGPAPAVAELTCAAGGDMRIEATRPVALDWVRRWTPRQGIEVNRPNSEPNMYDEHWVFVIHAVLAPGGTREPAQGECVWSSPNPYGLRIGGAEPVPLAIDIRLLSDDFPFDRVTMTSGGLTSLTIRERRGLGPSIPLGAAIRAMSAIAFDNGRFTVPVRPSDNPAPSGGVIVEHIENDALSFREPATAAPGDGPD